MNAIWLLYTWHTLSHLYTWMVRPWWSQLCTTCYGRYAIGFETNPATSGWIIRRLMMTAFCSIQWIGSIQMACVIIIHEASRCLNDECLVRSVIVASYYCDVWRKRENPDPYTCWTANPSARNGRLSCTEMLLERIDIIYSMYYMCVLEVMCISI
jgi:hypothetical protein